MARFDDLPADQKAVLQLVLRQGRTYDEIAGLLKISPEAVRDRALGALDSLGPQETAGLGEDQQDEVGDYLLGQQSASQRAGTRELLERSAPGRAWARVVSGELRPLARDPLPDVPAEGAELDEAFGAQRAREANREDRRRSSRLGGVLLLVGAAVALAVILIAVLGGFSGSGGGGSSATTAAQATGTTSGQTKVEAQVNLQPPRPGSKALGVANVVSQDNQRAIAVIGQDLAPSPRYVLWLRNGSTSKFLGFFPPVAAKGAQKGRLQGLVAAPDDLAQYNELVVSRESSDKPTRPTVVVLRGSLGR